VSTPSARRWAAGVVLALPGALAASACTGGEARGGAGRLDVVLIVVDTLRADHLGLYGYDRPTSPFLDRLAERSAVAETMVAQAPWTKPAVASMLTSLYPEQHRALKEGTGNRLADELETLPELLRAAGYRTAGFSENPHVGPSTGFDQGFDEFRVLQGFDGRSDWVLGEARRWLEESDAAAPAFLYLHFLDPHGPFEPDPADAARFLEGRSTDNELVRKGLVGKLVRGRALREKLSTDDFAYLTALYDAEIRGVDRALETLFDALAAHLDDALVIVTSDHGEEFGEHGALRHGFQLYEETLRVPLIVAGPGVVPGRIADVPLAQIDLAPTVLELAGLPAPAAFRGTSFAARLRGGALAERPLVSQTRFRGSDRSAVRAGGWKLIVDDGLDRRELYRLPDDAAERVDLAAAREDVAARLEGLLRDAVAPVEGLVVTGAEGAPDREAERALEHLGYLGE